jgi:hypothetical protein
MTDLEFERGLLERLLANTRNEVPAPGWFIGDRAGLRQMNDDLLSGSIFLRTAHERAKEGLAAIKQEDLELAKLCRREAERFLSEARGLALPNDRLEALRKGAARRGPPTKRERDIEFYREVAKRLTPGTKEKEAIYAAIDANPLLKDAFTIKTKTGETTGKLMCYRALRQSLQKAKKLTRK